MKAGRNPSATRKRLRERQPLVPCCVPPLAEGQTVTVFQDDRLKAVVFGFDQGQQLSEHTAAKPATLYFVKGEASVGLGDDTQEAQAGTWVHMPAGLKHAIKAKTPVVMLLVLLK